ncbi:unnamed protein product [Acanthoscelides obtectus]|uniref:Ig-like domain-containing protein n=1 Tax=Acanthoscelides obtectus TaxID=200917 RepID=A0A9P0KEI0_ACAOB|nr:unnamed protein product [Acanthoscelides obtectus]CAK1682953.1 Fibroblast growth factor receptor-like 1 [Acanthoscelides obtectus]
MRRASSAIFVCLFALVGGCHGLLDSGMSNDSPYENEPEKMHLRVKIGTPITLKCPNNATIWEYKPCTSSFQGFMCDSKPPWSRLNITRGRKHIAAVDRKHNGLYRCKDKTGVVRRVFLVDVVHPGYSGTKPNVAPLRISNLTGQVNMEFTIQCNVSSEVPPTIFWFKSCYRHKCDIEYNQVCYCHLNKSISSYNLGSTYLSKYSIFNARYVDSGVYACLAVTQYGENSQNVTITVPREEPSNNEQISWLLRKRSKPEVVTIDQQKQLIRPVVGNIATKSNEIV